MRQNWVMWSGGLSEDQTSMILKEAEKIEIERATTNDDSTADQVRKSDVGWLDVPEIQNLLWEYVGAANNNAHRVFVENI